jgi:hypothetical protein
VGGATIDLAHGLAVDASGFVTTAGSASSSDFPTTPGAWDTTHNGLADAIVTRLDMLPAGVSAYGASTPGCAGPLAIGVTSIPQVGNGAFALTCSNAPPNSLPTTGGGVLAFSGGSLASPSIVSGAAIWIDSTSFTFFTVFSSSNALGAAFVPVPIPTIPSLAGMSAFAQFAWPDACSPGGISASNALAIVVQP